MDGSHNATCLTRDGRSRVHTASSLVACNLKAVGISGCSSSKKMLITPCAFCPSEYDPPLYQTANSPRPRNIFSGNLISKSASARNWHTASTRNMLIECPKSGWNGGIGLLFGECCCHFSSYPLELKFKYTGQDSDRSGVLPKRIRRSQRNPSSEKSLLPIHISMRSMICCIRFLKPIVVQNAELTLNYPVFGRVIKPCFETN